MVAKDTLEQIKAFLSPLSELLPRANHLHWLSIYLWGLLETPERRSTEAIARALPAEFVPAGTSPSQSLQHFLSRGNWDEQRLLRALRASIASIGESGSTWVIHEAVFLKRGKRSVGVHRQFLRDQGTKANSQAAVLISQIGPSGYLPLALRLYLPRAWLTTALPSQIKEIPEEDRLPSSKNAIAVRLLRELLAEGRRPGSILAANGFAGAGELTEAIEAHALRQSIDSTVLLDAERGREWMKDRLGLDHFEGRSWRGWHHHAASVLLAYGYLVQQGVAH